MKKTISLLLLGLLCSIGTTWADDVVSATQTFTNNRATCTWTAMTVSVAKNSTASGDGLYFVAGNSGSISTSSGSVNIKSGRVMYVAVPSASSHGTITIIGSDNKNDRYVNLISENTIVMTTSGASTSFVASDVENVNGGYYIKVTSTSDFKFNSVSVTLTDEVYPAAVAVDPVFSLTKTSISTEQTAQIKVGTKNNLDGIELSNITYGTPGVVTVNATTGVITPSAAGSTTINFNSSAVAGKYNASTGNSLTITVTEAVLVFDAAGLTNEEIILSQANIETWDYLSCTSSYWTDKGWSSPYNGSFLDMKTDRTISITMKNVYAFEVYLSGNAGRTYSVKVGSADAVEYTQGGNGSGFASSGVIATGTMGQIIIIIEGGAYTLYPAYVKVNPTITLGANGWSTFAAPFKYTVDGATVYKAAYNGTNAVVLTEVSSAVVPANEGIILKGTEGATATITPSEDAASDFTGNQLVGVVAPTAAPANAYVISTNGNTTAFNPCQLNLEIPANKAYMIISGSSAPDAIRIEFNENDATDIKSVEGGETAVKFIENGRILILKDGVVYDALGRAVK